MNVVIINRQRKKKIDARRLKLAAAILFNYTIHRKVAQSDSSSQGVRVVVAVVSLALWISVVFGGLFIAFA